jgi:hypothetical protein
MRCALVEFTPSHGWTAATFVSLLNRLGVAVDVYLRSEVLESDPFAFSSDPPRRTHRLESWLVRARLKTRHFAEYDFVLATSCEPRTVLPRLSTIPVPVLGVVHNAVLLAEDEEYRRFFGEERRRPLVLARHVEAYLGPRVGARWVAPVHVMDDPAHIEIAWNRFCVQGLIDFRRRNYAGLLDAVEQLDLERRHDFEITLLGRDSGLDGIRFRRMVRQRGLGERFRITGDLPGYAEYFPAIASCGFVLPLVDSSPHLRMYFEDKITSSISMAVGMGRIPVVHAALAELYGLDSCALTFNDGDLAASMATALELSGTTRREMCERLTETRRAWLETSEKNLADALHDLGLEPPATVPPSTDANRSTALEKGSGGSKPAGR